MTKPEIILTQRDLDAIEMGLVDATLTPEFIDALETELARAKIVKPAELPNDRVALDQQVTFRVLETEKVFTRTLVVPRKAPSADDNLSVFAPLGAALIGLSIGQRITWQTNRGLQTVEVLAVEAREVSQAPTAKVG